MRYAKWTWAGVCFALYLAAVVLFFDGGPYAAFVFFSGLVVMPVVWAAGIALLYLGGWLVRSARG